MCNVLDYWRNPPDAINKPESYAKFQKRSDFLMSFLPDYVDITSSIVELGCNCGRNLNALYLAGYKDLSGVDINTSALCYGATQYKELFDEGRFYNESIESWLKTNPKQYDCIFTMAVLEHIPKESAWVFTNISAKARHVIITVEDERSGSPRHFPRHYRDIFTKLGWAEVFTKEATQADELIGITARVFKENNL